MSLVYLNNPNLKASGVDIPFTQEQLDEYIRCSTDINYFVRNYVKIVSLDRGIINFEMYDFQQEIIETYQKERKVIVKLGRQSGKTTTTVAFLLWYVIFNDTKTAAILANKAVTAREILDRIKTAYEHLPKWMQQGVVEWNKGSIALENKSRILAAATSSSAIRGFSINCVFLDEYAHVPNNIADEFFASIYPTISSGKDTKILIASTPKGMNHYYKFWVDATEKRNGFVPLQYHYSAVPGRDEKWAMEQRNILGEVKYQQEVECEFLGSSHSLITGTKLRQLAHMMPIESKDGYDIYEYPIKGHTYILSVDVSRGLGRDSSVFSVIDISEIPYKQVAKYKSSEISPMLFPNIIYNFANKYNEAYVIVEINDNGQQVADILFYDLEYEHVYRIESNPNAGQRISPGFKRSVTVGLRTTQSTKRIGCSNLKTLIESDKLIIRDFDTISELATFTQQKNSYAADEGYHDDLVMTLVFFAWITTQTYFKESTNTDIRKLIAQEQNILIEESVTPFGFIDDGINDNDYTIEDGDLWRSVKSKYSTSNL